MIITDEVLEQITKQVGLTLEGQRDILDATIKDVAYKTLAAFTDHEFVSVSERLRVVNHCLNSMKKLGILQPILDDPSVTEIMINGPDDIFIERAGRLLKLEEHFENNKQLEDIIQRIVAKVNRTVDSSNPICDARLEDGSRVNIVLAPIALNGATVTIRKFPEKVISFEDLISWGAVTKEAAEFLRLCVKAKYNIFVSGGTGSGKTTFLNALSNYIPSDERIITIEDSAELQIQSVKNLVRLETRNANAEGKGEITIRDLIKSSLRMRPERIVVGEVRGAEALDMLQAMNTGHDGSLSTGHANSPADMLSRLETMVLTGSAFPIEAIRQQISSAIDIVVHLGRMSDKSRKVLDIVELLDYKDGKYQINQLFRFEMTEESRPGKVAGSLNRSKNKFSNTRKFIMAGIPYEKL